MATIFRFGITITLLLLSVCGPPSLRAQQPQQTPSSQQLQQISRAQILDRIRSSGLSQAQARRQLAQAGYDPGLLDEYYAELEGRAGAPAPNSVGGQFLEALRQIGLIEREMQLQLPDSLRADTTDMLAMADTLSEMEEDSVRIFGKQLFARATTEFEPVRFGPVDPDYRLGPGDQLSLILTGAVELAYTLDVTREGYIVIPQVGQVYVNGLTLEELRDQLYTHLGRAYSGIRRGPEATTFFQVSLGRLRVNQVYVIGEVERPGAYQVSAVSTVFDALYRAGGPNEDGSFRDVQVRRGGEVIAEVDVYDYLLDGGSSGDVRLEQNDVVFVPLTGPRVRLDGEVRRRAIFEVDDNDGLRDVIRYAGGFEPEAFVDRVQIERILPPTQRTPARQRVLVDVPMVRLLEDTASVAVVDGDRIHVGTVAERQRNVVVVRGAVFRPGQYEWVPGMTLGDLISRANGLAPDAYRAVAHVRSLNEEDGSYRLHQVALTAGETDEPARALPLQDLDEVTVFERSKLSNPRYVEIAGQVKEPGVYDFATGMTVRDLILAAGGFTPEAVHVNVEVARPNLNADLRRDTLVTVHEVALEGADLEFNEALRGTNGLNASTVPVADAAQFELSVHDRVFVRSVPGVLDLGTVVVEGQVAYPGAYALRRRDTRVTDLIEQAGGLSSEAYLPGARLVRDSIPVALDLEDALRNRRGDSDIRVFPDDRLVVPQYDPTVLVQGAVPFESRVAYRAGAGLDYYVEQAGGYLEEADEGKTFVTYQNGERKTAGGFLFFSSKPKPEAGSVVTVPREPERQGGGFDVQSFLTTTLGMATSLATLILAIDRINN